MFAYAEYLWVVCMLRGERAHFIHVNESAGLLSRFGFQSRHVRERTTDFSFCCFRGCRPSAGVQVADDSEDVSVHMFYHGFHGIYELGVNPQQPRP